MKYFLRVLLVILLVIAVIFGANYFFNGAPEKKEGTNILTTVTKAPATEKNSDRVLLASLKKEDFYLYKSNTTVILRHHDMEYKFENWSSMIDEEPPQMFYGNFDSDDEKELVVKAVAEIDSQTKEYVYNIYLLNPYKDKNGNTQYTVTMASRSTWVDILDNFITAELSQLKSCSKFVQFSMNKADESITYDKKTGIAKNGHNGYARALQNTQGQYMHVDKWSRGVGVYTIKGNKIFVDIAIDINYKNSTFVQKAGFIHFQLALDKSNRFYPAEKSLKFTAAEDYRISDPTVTADVPWSYTENNTDTTASQNDKIINWVKYDTKYDKNITTQSVSFNADATDNSSIDKIVITESYMELTSKDGYSFDEQAAKNGEFSVVINKGAKDEFDISYTAQVIKNKNNQILKITFDKKYPQSEINSISVNLGTK